MVHACAESLASLCCGHGGRCSRALLRHVVLAGTDPLSKRLWTAIAQPYPPSFAFKAATVLAAAVSAQRGARKFQFAIQ
eukprot:5371272-Lingulodinium_polyedra.AAC.1